VRVIACVVFAKEPGLGTLRSLDWSLIDGRVMLLSYINLSIRVLFERRKFIINNVN
jgi:hypothetical protein